MHGDGTHKKLHNSIKKLFYNPEHPYDFFFPPLLLIPAGGNHFKKHNNPSLFSEYSPLK